MAVTTDRVLAELEQARIAFSKPGKHELSDALEILDGLKLSPEADTRVRQEVIRSFQKDESAGLFRYDSLVGILEILQIRLAR